MDKLDAEHAVLAPRAVGPVQKLTVSGPSADRTTELSPGSYELAATGAVNYLQGGSSVTADASDYYLPAGAVRLFVVSGSGDDYLSVFGTADAYVMPLS